MDKNEFSERLYKMRSEKGLSQKQLGELLGVSNKAISKWETGEAMPKTETMLKLAEIMGIDGNELLGITAEQSSDESINKEIDRLKSENLALQEKIDLQSKKKKKTLVSACIVFSVIILAVALVLIISGVQSNKKPNIDDAGKTGTVIVFNGSEFLPCNERQNALLDFNKDEIWLDELKNAKYIGTDKTKMNVTVNTSSDIKLLELKTAQGDFYYLEKELSVTVSPENLESVSLRHGSFVNNDYYADTSFVREYSPGYSASDNRIKTFCDYYNDLSSPADKKITELHLGNNGKIVSLNFKNQFVPSLEVGEFFEDENNELYFYSYADGKAYYAGKELNEFVNR